MPTLINERKMTRCQKSCGRSSLEFWDGRCRVLWTGIKTGFPGARLWTEHLPSIGPRWTGSNSLRKIVLSGEKARQSRPPSSTPAIRRGVRSRETAFRSALLNFMGVQKALREPENLRLQRVPGGSPSAIMALPFLMWEVVLLQSDFGGGSWILRGILGQISLFDRSYSCAVFLDTLILILLK